MEDNAIKYVNAGLDILWKKGVDLSLNDCRGGGWFEDRCLYAGILASFEDPEISAYVKKACGKSLSDENEMEAMFMAEFPTEAINGENPPEECALILEAAWKDWRKKRWDWIPIKE